MNIEKITTSDEAKKILSRFNVINLTDIEIAQALLMAEAEGMNKPGDCETCRFISWDGELGTIQCCDKDVNDVPDKGYEVDDKIYPYGECPLWESNSTLDYCKKHNRWYSNSWELACPSCYTDWEKQGQEEYEKSKS